MAHSNDSGGDFHIVLQERNIIDKAFVDFQHIQRKVFEIGQRRITGSLEPALRSENRQV